MALLTDLEGFRSVFLPLYLSPTVCYPEKVNAIYEGEIPLTSSYLSLGYSVYPLALDTTLGVPLSPSNADVIETICRMWRSGTKGGTGDPYYGRGLVKPEEVVFFKTNIDDHEHTLAVRAMGGEGDGGEKEDAGVAFCFAGELRSFVHPTGTRSDVGAKRRPKTVFNCISNKLTTFFSSPQSVILSSPTSSTVFPPQIPPVTSSSRWVPRLRPPQSPPR